MCSFVPMLCASGLADSISGKRSILEDKYIIENEKEYISYLVDEYKESARYIRW